MPEILNSASIWRAWNLFLSRQCWVEFEVAIKPQSIVAQKLVKWGFLSNSFLVLNSFSRKLSFKQKRKERENFKLLRYFWEKARNFSISCLLDKQSFFFLLLILFHVPWDNQWKSNRSVFQLWSRNSLNTLRMNSHICN